MLQVDLFHIREREEHRYRLPKDEVQIDKYLFHPKLQYEFDRLLCPVA